MNNGRESDPRQVFAARQGQRLINGSKTVRSPSPPEPAAP